MTLNEKQVELCDTSRWDFSDLSLPRLKARESVRRVG